MPGDPVIDIKARLNIEDVVSSYVQLKKAGRSLKACCPFHNEKTPSFVVSPERQLAYCFGCNKGGDMFTFIEEIEGVDFKGAIEILAEKANIDLSEYKVSSAPKVSKDHKESLYDVNVLAGKFYQDLLMSSKEGKKALQYLEGRGFTAETINEFELGLSPDSFDATNKHLVQKNCSQKDLLELGLLISKDTGSGKVYDRFRLRLMFPIWNAQSKIVGFGGRALKKGDEPKYLNSPESPIYHKGDVLYGFDKAKKAIREKDLAVVVEGYMDVMASHQAGIKNVVASSGTALTEAQIKLIKRFTKNVAFAFDTDKAGQDALRRATELGQVHELNMHVIQVPEGKDPDECIQQDPSLWEKAVQEAPFYLDYYMADLVKQFDVTSLEGKTKACQAFLPWLRKASSIEKDHYFKQLALLLQTDPSFIYDEFNALKKDPYATAREPRDLEKATQTSDDSIADEEYFVALLLAFPEQIIKEVLTIDKNILSKPVKTIYKQIESEYNAGASVDVHGILGKLKEEEQKRWEVSMLYAEAKNGDLAKEMISQEMQDVGQRLLKWHHTKQAKALMLQIRQAQEDNDREREDQLFQEYSRLLSH